MNIFSQNEDVIIFLKNKEEIEKTILDLKESIFNKNITTEYIKELSVKYSEKAIFIVLREKDKTVGCLSLYANNIKSREAFLSMILVQEDRKHCGIGSKLLNKAEKIARDNNMKSITLSVNKSNLNAINFYIKKGYHKEKENIESYIYKKDL